MKNLVFLFLATSCLSFVSLSGCGGGGGEGTVVEAPAETTEEASMPGMTEEEYNKAMEADLE